MNVKTCSLSLLALLVINGAMADPPKKTETISLSRPAPEMDDMSHKNYGNNILAFSPLQLMDKGVGVQLSYERALDRKNYVSLYLPVSVAFKDFDDNSNTDFTTVYIMPGIKFYPTGGKGLIRYAVGPNITYATGTESVTTGQYINNQYISVTSNENFYKLGMMITNSMNINPIPRLHLGLELGLGFTYLDGTSSGVNSTDGPFNLVQFGFKAGYRF